MKQVKVKKKLTSFRPMILSRHPSHDILRLKSKRLPLFQFRSVVRFGSTTEVNDTIAKGGSRVEINTVESIKNSSSKLKMKQCFTDANVKTAPWITSEEISKIGTENFNFPIVAKNYFGSRGRGNTLIKTEEEFDNWKQGKTLSNYIFEKFVNYGLEYRLHITEEGCFYSCRKALKKDCPEDQKWRHHDDTCVWFLETNENFMKPNSWEDIVNDCVKALKSIGADILSFDVKVQNSIDRDGNKRKYQDYILLECNSASSMGDYNGEPSICASKYIEILPKLIYKKYKNDRK